MKKPVKLVIIICLGGFLVLGWITARLTHTLNYYKFTSTSNLPTYQPGNIFFASNLKDPDYGRFVCFKNNTAHEIWLFRVIGKPGDVIEIKDAVVYRNGNRLSETYAWDEYILSKTQYIGIQGYIEHNKNTEYQLSDTTYKVTLTESEVKQYRLNCKKYISPVDSTDTIMVGIFRNKRYTVDNFGPIKVPADSYFLMGDNRHDAMDSRYIGFVKREDIISTKLGN